MLKIPLLCTSSQNKFQKKKMYIMTWSLQREQNVCIHALYMYAFQTKQNFLYDILYDDNNIGRLYREAKRKKPPHYYYSYMVEAEKSIKTSCDAVAVHSNIRKVFFFIIIWDYHFFCLLFFQLLCFVKNVFFFTSNAFMRKVL